MEIDEKKGIYRLSVYINLCKEEDLGLLEREMPSPGKSKSHERRFRMQEDDSASYLIAWRKEKEKPIGHILIKWGGLGRDLPEDLKIIPELNSLVVAKELRGMGVGRTLIKEAEARVKKKGFKNVGLLVSLNNKYAKRLYERLGYKYSSSDIYIDSGKMIDNNGNKYIDSEDCLAMFKNL
jgi:ribosomal protein S18 acetylase RimI-like enzyme